jgi:hypothetical protein
MHGMQNWHRMYGTYACDYVFKKTLKKHELRKKKTLSHPFLFGSVHKTTFSKG